ncbi:hypothetical protein [Methylobacterium sp. WL9]|uniref:hypothetical protein n=1 Tax=Methylobacterium sp. WL9 TaxID=2603898 RepID=UPI0011CA3F97|nr:hypothetical protein [Methylobacterium sp. WL9]TXN23968.1 hypothetical protein FV217_04695 [Methylobacterium sp. WL9]
MSVSFDFAEDATKLKWRYEERRDGEIARFEVCGLHAYARDCDGDFTFWLIRKGKQGAVLAEGETRDFFPALREAEAALRRIVSARIAEMRDTPPRPNSDGVEDTEGAGR